MNHSMTKKKACKVLLIAKPWKGGLGQYFFQALQDFFEDVHWILTYPVGFHDQLAYRRNKKRWRIGLTHQIASADYDIAFFINTINEFAKLEHSDRNIIWITDDPRPVIQQLDAYGRVYLADPGYKDDVIPYLRGTQYGGILPFAHLPGTHTPHRCDQPKNGVCFIGNRDPKRDPFFDALLSSKVILKIYGNYFLKSPLFWRYPGSILPAVPNLKMGRIYSRYAMAINIHAQVVRGGTNMRTFECAGYAIPQAVEIRPGLEDYFEPEREIAVFRSSSEAVEKIERLIKDQKMLQAMAHRAREHALAAHTYHHRIKTLLKDFSL